MRIFRFRTSRNVTRAGLQDRQTLDIPATASFNRMTVEALSDLDPSYTPPLGSPWDALQAGAQTWERRLTRRHRPPRRTSRAQTGAPAHSGQTKSEAGPAMPTSRIALLASESAACSASVSGRQSDHRSRGRNGRIWSAVSDPPIPDSHIGKVLISDNRDGLASHAPYARIRAHERPPRR